MEWKIAEAKQSFSKVVRAARDEPQMIYKRDELVAVVVEPDTLKDFLNWRESQRKPTLAEAAARVRQAFCEEDYVLEIPSRQKERPNALLEVLDEVSG